MEIAEIANTGAFLYGDLGLFLVWAGIAAVMIARSGSHRPLYLQGPVRSYSH